MGRVSWLFLVFTLALSACYQVTPGVVGAGVAVPGWRDGVYGRADGTQVDIRWDAEQGGYRVDAGGMVRVAALAGGLYLADYRAERSIALLARLGGDGDLVFLAPTPEVEGRGLAEQGLALRPGPVPRLDGPVEAVRRYFSALAAQGSAAELTEIARLRWLHS